MDNATIAAALRAMANVFDAAQAPVNLVNATFAVAQEPKVVKPRAAKAATAVPATNVEASATPAIAATTAAVAPVVAPTVAATATTSAPELVAPPTTMQAAAEVLKTMVQTQKAGCGRDAAVALLGTFGASMLAQVPATKLAEFQAKALAAINGVVATAAADPLAGLVG